ncbi:MAG: maltose acetyltransferase domain-containing protein [Blautia sp.]
MDNITRRDLELPYIADEAVMEEQKVTRRLLREFNTTDPSNFQTLSQLLGKIIGGSHKNIMVMPPFYCDYGSHIEVGENFFVIGAGSVVTKDIPDNMVAAGNPCRVIREITEEDKKYYYKNRKFDEEAWTKIEKNCSY